MKGKKEKIVKKEKKNAKLYFRQFSTWITKATGTSTAFFIALLVIVVWAISGYFFNFSEVWQLVINTGTTIVTFLMIFVIQQSQNRDTLALHLKLNELIAANETTSNRLVASEDLTEEELDIIKKYYKKISELSKKKQTLFTTHSLDEAEQTVEQKEGTTHTSKHHSPKK
jgi:low affinity Fe/Cu permease